jgi:hypothetical protein
MASRDDMNRALKEVAVPALRALGFKGSLPHLHRQRADGYDLLSFQFRSDGGSFVVEVGRVGLAGILFAGRTIPANKLNTTYLEHRHRLGAPLSGGDHWYQFEAADPRDVVQQLLSDLQDSLVWNLIDSFPLPPHG